MFECFQPAVDMKSMRSIFAAYAARKPQARNAESGTARWGRARAGRQEDTRAASGQNEGGRRRRAGERNSPRKVSFEEGAGRPGKTADGHRPDGGQTAAQVPQPALRAKACDGPCRKPAAGHSGFEGGRAGASARNTPYKTRVPSGWLPGGRHGYPLASVFISIMLHGMSP